MSKSRARNCERVSRHDVLSMPFDNFRKHIIKEAQSGARVISLFGVVSNGGVTLFGVLAFARTGELSIISSEVNSSFPSITPECPQVHMFEREIGEQCGIRPEGHPWFKPVRFHKSYNPGHDAWRRESSDAIEPGVTDFFRVEGEEIHEVAVGPVHAGVIEPGHFRFQCHGEDVLHLEISLGYQHRGVEKALIKGPNLRAINYMETLAGDTTVGHTIAYCQALEALSDCRVPARAEAIRGLALELERVANHAGDLGALASDVGYLPTSSYCGRLRGDILNLTALVCGNRFGRGWIRPGGVVFDLEKSRADELSSRLKKTFQDLKVAVDLLWKSPSVMARFEDTGAISKQTAEELGLVGIAARACGIHRDVRYEFPSGIYSLSHIPISMWQSGDVFARAFVRWLEISRSVSFILEQIEHLPDGPIAVKACDPMPDHTVVSLVEAWRGEICHVAMTGPDGKFERYKVVDPSFHNWTGLAMAMRNQTISDFPLCNKSFNLSYCGHDL